MSKISIYIGSTHFVIGSFNPVKPAEEQSPPESGSSESEDSNVRELHQYNEQDGTERRIDASGVDEAGCADHGEHFEHSGDSEDSGRLGTNVP